MKIDNMKILPKKLSRLPSIGVVLPPEMGSFLAKKQSPGGGEIEEGGGNLFFYSTASQPHTEKVPHAKKSILTATCGN